MEKTKFLVETNEDGTGMSIEIEGSGVNLATLIANAIDGDPRLEAVVSMALMGVQSKREEGLEGMLSNIAQSVLKPRAEA